MAASQINFLEIISSKLRMLFLFILFSLLFLGAGYLYVQEIENNYDLYKNGKITNGVIKQVDIRTERRGSRKRRHTVTVYDHLIEYDSYLQKIELENRLLLGSKVTVYYSTKNNKNVTLKTDDHPFTSILGIINIKIFVFVFLFECFFLLGAFGNLFYLFKIPRSKEDL